MNEDTFLNKLEKALMKKAVGYNCKETTEEYAPDTENGKKKKILKIKTVKKYVPPDVGALKALAELQSGKVFTDAEFDTENMTDEAMSKEKERLIKIIQDAASRDDGADNK